MIAWRTHDRAGEPFKPLIQELERDSARIVGDYGKIALIVAYITAVECIKTTMLILWNMRGDAIDAESTILDAIGIATHDWTKVALSSSVRPMSKTGATYVWLVKVSSRY